MKQKHWISEFLSFLRKNVRWWLLPTLVMLVVLGVLLWFSGTPALSPFLYHRQ